MAMSVYTYYTKSQGAKYNLTTNPFLITYS